MLYPVHLQTSAMITTNLAGHVLLNQSIGAMLIQESMVLINPLLAKSDLNIIEYDTREVAQGKKIIVLKIPFPFSFGLFSI